MNSEFSHPVIGICILVFVISTVVLTLCTSLFDGDLWLILCLLPRLILTALVGCIAALWIRLSWLETQVRFLRDQLYKLEKDSATTSKM